ncbi:helix-turn-helix domain-containing protein [Mucilaginibacter celer]|uniref:Helix-turn-helix domain-containing protein n=1 Tax=Mucilaginibacter celer TaxID=2305508 RepID=A0A494VZJ9_9SPHI|nr:AraC family transcriptional regulator [Mucilaginibacter celer]AYL96575.1 helix-turn-helix domain-containing protein [Mucilaginibacter celer]
MEMKLVQSDIEDDLLILRKYHQIYTKYRDEGIIDLDRRLRHKFDFHIYRLEEVIPLINGDVPPTRQTPYWMVLVKHGSGQKSIGQFNFPIKDNTLFVVPKRVMHWSKYSSLDCTGYVMVFGIEYFLKTSFPKQCLANRKVLKTADRPYLHLSDSQADAIAATFESIMNEHTFNLPEKREMIAVKVLELLIQCDRMFAEAQLIGSEIKLHPLVEQFADLLDDNYHIHRDVQFYAQALNVHPNYLSQLLKKHNGFSTKESIDNRIIIESKLLLSNSAFIIKEIANRVGFEDPNNFSTFFQKHTGTSPLAYRAALLKFTMPCSNSAVL